MIEVFNNIAPILIELETWPVEQPVQISPLIRLFEKHTQFKHIEIVPSPIERAKLGGFHVSSSKSGRAGIFFPACHEVYIKDCLGCHEARFAIAKELIHTTDKNHQKTQPMKAAAELASQLIENEIVNDDGVADVAAEVCAVELLARFPSRKLVKGGFAFTRCANSGDYSYLATQYGVPERRIRRSFGDKYMEYIEILRKSVGMQD